MSPWIRGNVGFMGALLGWLSVAGSAVISIPAVFMYLNEIGSWCGTGRASAMIALHMSIPFFISLASAGWLLCKWTDLFRYSARLCIILVSTITVGSYGVLTLWVPIVTKLLKNA